MDFAEFFVLLFAGNWLGALLWLLQQFAGG